VTYKDYLKERSDAIREIRIQKKKLQEQMDEVMDKITKLEEERMSLRKNVNKEFQNPAEI
jgi:prefoldin subunit 5